VNDPLMSTINFQQHTHCLISGSDILKPVKGYEKIFLVKSPVGFVFCSRIPTEEELVDHYNTIYPRNDYLSPITVKRYNELLDDFERYRKTGRLLDVGCGVGYFLTEAKKRGWEVYGTEYTEDAICICEQRGINTKKGKLNAAWYEKESFDIVTSFEVIEHIYNPREEVKNINQVLRKGGLFYFTTPNFNAIERFILKEQYNVIQYPEHLSYYTKKTIHYLLTKNGFQRKRLQTTGISFTRIKTSRNKKNIDFITSDSKDERLRAGFEKNAAMQLVKKMLNGVLSFFGVGASLKGWYIKN
jgi:2-polyprenyl-3-methyl-5-hydroxy-6-metoxy-1,4-benzoquinol methylase